MAAPPSRPSSTATVANPSATWPSFNPTRASSGSAPERPPTATASAGATASTSRPTAGRRSNTWGCARRIRLPRSHRIRPTPTPSTSPRWAICLPTPATEGCSKRPMGARRGRSSPTACRTTARRARRSWSFIPKIQTSSSSACTSGCASPTTCTAAGPTAASSNRPTAGSRGASSPTACPPATPARSTSTSTSKTRT